MIDLDQDDKQSKSMSANSTSLTVTSSAVDNSFTRYFDEMKTKIESSHVQMIDRLFTEAESSSTEIVANNFLGLALNLRNLIPLESKDTRNMIEDIIKIVHPRTLPPSIAASIAGETKTAKNAKSKKRPRDEDDVVVSSTPKKLETIATGINTTGINTTGITTTEITTTEITTGESKHTSPVSLGYVAGSTSAGHSSSVQNSSGQSSSVQNSSGQSSSVQNSSGKSKGGRLPINSKLTVPFGVRIRYVAASALSLPSLSSSLSSSPSLSSESKLESSGAIIPQFQIENFGNYEYKDLNCAAFLLWRMYKDRLSEEYFLGETKDDVCLLPVDSDGKACLNAVNDRMIILREASEECIVRVYGIFNYDIIPFVDFKQLRSRLANSEDKVVSEMSNLKIKRTTMDNGAISCELQTIDDMNKYLYPAKRVLGWYKVLPRKKDDLKKIYGSFLTKIKALAALATSTTSSTSAASTTLTA